MVPCFLSRSTLFMLWYTQTHTRTHLHWTYSTLFHESFFHDISHSYDRVKSARKYAEGEKTGSGLIFEAHRHITVACHGTRWTRIQPESMMVFTCLSESILLRALTYMSRNIYTSVCMHCFSLHLCSAKKHLCLFSVGCEKARATLLPYTIS